MAFQAISALCLAETEAHALFKFSLFTGDCRDDACRTLSLRQFNTIIGFPLRRRGAGVTAR